MLGAVKDNSPVF